MAKQMGRPTAFDSPEQFDNLVDSYLVMCEESRRPVTLTGMVLALGITSKNTFYEYGKKDNFKDSVKRARLYIENSYEEKLHAAPKDIAAPSIIFALKNMDWTDQQDINIGGQEENPVRIADLGALTNEQLDQAEKLAIAASGVVNSDSNSEL